MIKAKRIILAGAALAGLIAGTSARAAALNRQDPQDQTGSSSKVKDKKVKEKHACKGQNSCKGKGGCKSSDNGCKGKNSCKGKGGCAADGSKMPE